MGLATTGAGSTDNSPTVNLVATLSMDQDSPSPPAAGSDPIMAYPSSGPFFAHCDPWGRTSADPNVWDLHIKLYDTFPHGTKFGYSLERTQANRSVKWYPQVVWRGANWWAAGDAGITNNFANNRAVLASTVTKLRTYHSATLDPITSLTDTGDGANNYGFGFDYSFWFGPDYFSTTNAYEILIVLRYDFKASANFVLNNGNPDPYGIIWEVANQGGTPTFLVIQPQNGPDGSGLDPNGWLVNGHVDHLWIWQQLEAYEIAHPGSVTSQGRNLRLNEMYFPFLRLGIEGLFGTNCEATLNNWLLAYTDNSGIAGNQYDNSGGTL